MISGDAVGRPRTILRKFLKQLVITTCIPLGINFGTAHDEEIHVLRHARRWRQASKRLRGQRHGAQGSEGPDHRRLIMTWAQERYVVGRDSRPRSLW
jgi:hypothetical protein